MICSRRYTSDYVAKTDSGAQWCNDRDDVKTTNYGTGAASAFDKSDTDTDNATCGRKDIHNGRTANSANTTRLRFFYDLAFKQNNTIRTRQSQGH